MLLVAASRISAVGEFLTVLVIFIFILAITYGTTRWIANYQKGRVFSKNIEVIETYKLNANKYMQIIKAGSKYLVVAVCKDTVTLLAELTEEEIKLPEENGTEGTDFREILDKVKKLTSKK